MIHYRLASLGAEHVRNEEDFVHRVLEMPIAESDYWKLRGHIQYVGVTDRFKDVMKTFPTEVGTPAGFRRELQMASDGVLRVDLVRDIAYDKNGERRPTNVLFSADSANPYEVAPISPFLANLTCNPGIIYDLFINNPKANVGNKYKTRDEVMEEIGRILGPGCDISVELNNPFEKDFNVILEEAEKFREMFSEYRVVIKVPHTGAVTPENVEQLLSGDKTLEATFNNVQTCEALRGHALTLKLHQLGFRICALRHFSYHLLPYLWQCQLLVEPIYVAVPYLFGSFLIIILSRRFFYILLWAEKSHY